MCQDSALVERPNCSSTRNHSSVRPALAAVLGRVRAAAEPRAASASRRMCSTSSAGSLPPRALGLVLERDEDLVDEAPRALLELGLLLGDVHGLLRMWEGSTTAVTDAGDERAGARRRILDAAVARIAREGIDEVRIARIAMDAGVSAALVHYHFESREPCWSRRSTTPTRSPATCARSTPPTARRRPSGCGRSSTRACRCPAPSATTGCCGSSSGCARRATRSCGRRARPASTAACTNGSPTRSPSGSPAASSSRSTPTSSPTPCWR